jgi:CheY-like chemotaxis protein
MKVLIVASRPQEALALHDGFNQAGFEVQVEHSGLFALTLMERNRPDVVVCTQALSDMSGPDLYELIRDDPKLNLVAFLLISNQPLQSNSPMDSSISPNNRTSTFVKTAYQLILEVARVTQSVYYTPETSKETFRGVLGEISLMELTQWMARSQKTGRLSVAIEQTGGTLLFSKGQVVHASLGDRSGEDAVLHLILQAERGKRGEFSFEPMQASDFFMEPITIQKSTDHLLLSLAVELDQARRALN